ncbi:hypothetical protein EXO78_06170 [Salmonella enterica]|nr:hypothetical protein [Salmonella enterica]
MNWMKRRTYQLTRELLQSLPQLERSALIIGKVTNGGPVWALNLPVVQLLRYVKNNLGELIKYGG